MLIFTALITSAMCISNKAQAIPIEIEKTQAQPVAEIVQIPQTVTLELPDEADGSFKTYMDYRAITNKNTTQYKMQQSATTNEDGFRIYEGRYMVAVGTYYAETCGVKLNITLQDGTVLYCITGDIKSNNHTEKTNRYVPENGNIVEFIVDTDKISKTSKKMGDMSYSGLGGAIIKIEVIL